MELTKGLLPDKRDTPTDAEDTAKKLVLKIDPYHLQQELVPKINSLGQAWPVRLRPRMPL